MTRSTTDYRKGQGFMGTDLADRFKVVHVPQVIGLLDAVAVRPRPPARSR